MPASSSKEHCRVGVTYGPESEWYSFPAGHPLNKGRVELFVATLKKLASQNPAVQVLKPKAASEEQLLLFHAPEYVDQVKKGSKGGAGYLDYGDTPAFPGVYEASLFTAGGALYGVQQIMQGECDHFFHPVGGLHHARRERAGGFCVFNDCALAISYALKEWGLETVAYVDIDAHQGDGVYYGFESEPRVLIGDIHEDGRFLYPGTGFSHEVGKGAAAGTKVNLPLRPGATDSDFLPAFDRIEAFLRGHQPQFIFFQCGADGLEGDPLTHLSYTFAAHAYAAKRLHALAHELCQGRILAMGGGGYRAENVNAAWSAVLRELAGAV